MYHQACQDSCKMKYGGSQEFKSRCYDRCLQKNRLKQRQTTTQNNQRSPKDVHQVAIFKSDHANRNPIPNKKITSDNFFPVNLGALVNL